MCVYVCVTLFHLTEIHQSPAQSTKDAVFKQSMVPSDGFDYTKSQSTGSNFRSCVFIDAIPFDDYFRDDGF
jgi:hypothetical protein